MKSTLNSQMLPFACENNEVPFFRKSFTPWQDAAAALQLDIFQTSCQPFLIWERQWYRLYRFSLLQYKFDAAITIKAYVLCGNLMLWDSLITILYLTSLTFNSYNSVQASKEVQCLHAELRQCWTVAPLIPECLFENRMIDLWSNKRQYEKSCVSQHRFWW